MGQSSLPRQMLASNLPPQIPISSLGGLGTAMATTVTPLPWGLSLPKPLMLTREDLRVL